MHSGAHQVHRTGEYKATLPDTAEHISPGQRQDSSEATRPEMALIHFDTVEVSGSSPATPTEKAQVTALIAGRPRVPGDHQVHSAS